MKSELDFSWLTYLGIGMIVLSAFYPWMHMEAGPIQWKLGPLWTSEFRPSSVLLLLTILVLILLVKIEKVPSSALAIPCQIWGIFALFFWIFGVGLRGMLPDSIFPNSVIPTSSFTILLAIIGSILVSASTFLIDSGRSANSSIPIGDFAIATLLVLLLLGSRDLPWLEVNSASLTWHLGAEVIPVIGGLVSTFVLTISIAVIIELLTEKSWLQLVIGVCGGIISTLGIVVVVLRSMVYRLAKIGINAIGINVESTQAIQFGIGPWALVLGGTCAIGFSTYKHYGTR